MTREASKYCEECKYCKEISYDNFYNTCTVICNEGLGGIGIHYDAVMYCKRKKIKKKKKEN